MCIPTGSLPAVLLLPNPLHNTHTHTHRHNSKSRDWSLPRDLRGAEGSDYPGFTAA